MAGEIKTLEFSEGVSVSTPFDAGSGSGTGEVNFVENNNGASDLDQSQTDAVGDWVDSGTGTTSSVTTTTGEIPRYPFQTTAIKITNDGSGTAYTAIRFRVPPADRSKKLKIEWAQKPDGSIYASGDFDIELYNYSDAYSTGETQVSIIGNDNGIPNQTGVNYYEFDSDDREYYELRFVRSAGSASGFIAINDFVVGPGKLHSGAVVTAWESYTAGLSGFTANNQTMYWRRVGESIQIQGTIDVASVSGNMIFDLPSGLTFDTTQLVTSQKIGSVVARDVDLVQHWTLGVFYDDSNSMGISGTMEDGTTITTSNDYADTNSPFSWSSGDLLRGFWIQAPISNWQNSGVLSTIVQDNLTEWETWTPTGNWTTNTTYFGKRRRVGQDWQVEVAVTISGGAPNSATFDVDIPELTFDTGGVIGNGSILGLASLTDSGTGSNSTLGSVVWNSGTGTVEILPIGSNSKVDESNPFTFGSGDVIRMSFRLPISEYAGSQSSLVGFSTAGENRAGLLEYYKEATDVGGSANWVSPPGSPATVTADVDYIRTNNLVTVHGTITVGASGNTDDIVQLGNGSVPSPTREAHTVVHAQSDGVYNVRVNTLGNVLIYSRDPTNLSSGQNYSTSDSVEFTITYTLL